MVLCPNGDLVAAHFLVKNDETETAYSLARYRQSELSPSAYARIIPGSVPFQMGQSITLTGIVAGAAQYTCNGIRTKHRYLEKRTWR